MTSFITAIGTANPANRFAQRDIVRFMSRTCRRANGSEVKMEALYRATGIRHRYTVLEDMGKPPVHLASFQIMTSSNHSRVPVNAWAFTRKKP